MDHYETLGVDRAATAADIKRAFKRKASKAHPDREGGDAKQMAEINRAYGVLASPEKRKAYDETGADGPVQSFEQKVELVLMQAFSAVLDRPGNMAKLANEQIEAGQRQQISQAAALHNQIDKLQKRRKNVRKVGEGANLAQRIIDDKLAQMMQAKAAMAEQANVLREAAKRAKEYREDYAEENPFASSTFSVFR